jgi:hypothetical protein
MWYSVFRRDSASAMVRSMWIHDFELETVIRSSEIPELVSHDVTVDIVVSSAAKVSATF